MCSGGRLVKLLACGARGPGFDSPPRHLNFQRLVISCFKVEIWLKYRLIDVYPQNNQPTNNVTLRLSRAIFKRCTLTISLYSCSSISPHRWQDLNLRHMQMLILTPVALWPYSLADPTHAKCYRIIVFVHCTVH